MKNRDDILDHLRYGLAHLDGFCWLCDFLISHAPSHDPTSIVVEGHPVISLKSFAPLQNALAEAGFIYCRKLLDFLGLTLPRRRSVLTERPRHGDDTVGIEDLGLPRVQLEELKNTPFGTRSEIVAACEHTLRCANKGVAHFTENRGESSDASKALLCGKVVCWLVENKVYSVLNLPRPSFRVWTGPAATE